MDEGGQQMGYAKAIVTLALGEKYLTTWRRVCEANWSAYAQKHGYDIVCIDAPLDSSARARQRSPSWQKCLILGQDAIRKYERVVWVDADILINVGAAPSIVEGVPADKVGAVEALSAPTKDIYVQTLQRLYDFWHSTSLINYTGREYYANWGLQADFDEVVQCGVLVLSPRHHRVLLEKTYDTYEEKGGREWHMEMRPLSYELVRAGAVCWIDHRFNLNWGEQRALHYPFLLDAGQPGRTSVTARVQRKLRLVSAPRRRRVSQLCATVAFLNSFMLHFGGSDLADMELVDLNVSSWRGCRALF
jgi:hypothetical protein